MPAYDQRFVRRKGNSFVSLSNTVPLCQSCGGNKSCPIAGNVKKGEACAMFQPVITFPDQRGLRQPFNTFRRGKGVFNRLRDGETVALFSKADAKIVGEGVVKSRVTAPLGELLPTHATNNHLMLGDTPDVAVPKLRKVLRQMYGTNYGAEDKTFSVVYVEPKRGDQD